MIQLIRLFFVLVVVSLFSEPAKAVPFFYDKPATAQGQCTSHPLNASGNCTHVGWAKQYYFNYWYKGWATSFTYFYLSCPDGTAFTGTEGYLPPGAARPYCAAIPLDLEPVPEKENPTSCAEGNPVYPDTGQKRETEVDYLGPGPFPLRYARYYNSKSSNTQGWNTSYTTRLQISESDGQINAIVHLDSGYSYTFRDIAHLGAGDADIPGKVQIAGDGYRYLDKTGTTYEFDNEGRLTRITNWAGFTQSLTYANDKLVSVTDHFGRSIGLTQSDHGQVESLTLPGGDVYRYTYYAENTDGKRLLKSVVLPDESPLFEWDNPRREYLYESAHLNHGLTGIIDENGKRYSTFDYDSDGKAILSTHHQGIDLTNFSYTDDSTSVTNALGKVTDYTYEDILDVKRLVRIDGQATANCLSTTKTMEYDQRGSVIRRTSATGVVTQYTYAHTGLALDEYTYHTGLETSRTVAEGTNVERTITTEWHDNFRLPVRITEPGKTTEFDYDDKGRLIEKREIDPETERERIVTYSYNADGLLASIDGPRSDVDDIAHFAYNAMGELTTITNALDHETQVLERNAPGLPTRVADANGTETALAYDARRRLVSRTLKSDQGDVSTGFSYDEKGNMIEITLPNGAHLYYTYDQAYRLSRIHNDLGESLNYTLDNVGNRVLDVTGPPATTLCAPMGEYLMS